MGAVGFVVDGANLWFHHQSAQTAVDAACDAAAMDTLSVAASVSPQPSWIPASADDSSFDCTGASVNFAPCRYAAFNGYSASGSQNVQVSFPKTSNLPTGFSAPPDCLDKPPYAASVCTADINGNGVASTPYVKVDLTENVPTTFMRLVGARSTTPVPSHALCGLSNVLSPVPVLVLNPNLQDTLTGSGSLTVEVSGSTNVPKLIQVNSLQGTSLNFTGSVTLTNADGTTPGVFAVGGRQGSELAGGSSDKWVNAAGVMSDPFAIIKAPPRPVNDCTIITNCVKFGAPVGTLGCPSGLSCDLYQAGYYPALSNPCSGAINGIAAICVGKGKQPIGSPTATGLAVFEPGIYYLDEDFYADSTSCLRSATAGGDDSGGTMFYLSGLAVLTVDQGSGSSCASSFPAVSLSSTACTGTLNLPTSVTVSGNVLLAPCSGAYGDPTGAGNRGILFFHDRDVRPDQAHWAGSGALVGNMYYHYCHSGFAAGSGANCASDAFTETLNFDNGSNVYVVGGIVVDQLAINSGAQIHVVLNPDPQYYVLKASLLQ